MANTLLPFNRQRLRLGLQALGCVLISLAAWGFTPRPVPNLDPAPALRVLLVDASASVLRTQRSWLPWVRGVLEAQAEQAAGAGEELALISFARDVGLAFGPGHPEEFLLRLRGSRGDPLDPRSSAGERDASELAQALGLAASLCLAEGRAVGRVLLVGCDGYTGAGPSAGVARLRRAGVALELLPAPSAHWHELSLLDLRLEPELEPGAPILALARLAYRPGLAQLDSAYLEVEIRHAGELQSKRIELQLPPLGGEFEQPIACGPAGPGRTQVQVRVRLLPEPGDPMPENDVLVGATRASGARVILVVAEEAQQQAARAWLTATGESSLAGIQFVFSTPQEMRLLLSEVDAVVCYDVPLFALPGSALEAFVKGGKGLFVTSGGEFLRGWSFGMPDEGLAALLPAGPQARDASARDVVLLVDGSGSMSGEPFDIVRGACLDLVRNAGPEDRVVLRFFTIGMQAEHVIKQRASRFDVPKDGAQSAARRLLDLHVPSGSTHILESVEQFARGIQGQPQETLLFVLTDGIELDAIADLEQRARELHALLLKGRAQIVPIAIGKKQNLDFLRLLARPGQALARPEGLEDLRELFRREISSDRFRQGKDLVLKWAPGAAGELARDLRGLGAQALAPIDRLIRNRLKPWGEALWLADEGEPVLSAGRVGSGRVALLASLPGAGWGPRWVGRAGFGQPAEFEHLLRWLAREGRRDPSGVELEQEGRELILKGLDSRWPASFEATLVDAIASEQVEFERLVFEPLSGSIAGNIRQRRRARLQAAPGVLGAGAPMLRLVHPGGALQLLPIAVPRAPEFLGQKPLEAHWFEAPAEPQLGSHRTPQMGINPSSPYLLAMGLLALFFGFVRQGR